MTSPYFFPITTCSSKEEICQRYSLKTSNKQLASKRSSPTVSWQDKAESNKWPKKLMRTPKKRTYSPPSPGASDSKENALHSYPSEQSKEWKILTPVLLECIACPDTVKWQNLHLVFYRFQTECVLLRCQYPQHHF